MTTDPQLPAPPTDPDNVASSNAALGAGSDTLGARPSASRKMPAQWNRWLSHLALLLFVSFCAVIGCWLALLPWSLQWTDNPLLWTHPDLRTFLGYGFVRGICSGLGLLDLWIGVREAAVYYESAAMPQ